MKSLFLLSISLVFTLFNQNSNAATSFSEAFSTGHTELSLRYRYERVESDAFERDANASTLRTRLNYSTAPYKGMTWFIEFDDVSEILGDNYNSGAGTTPDRIRFPVVADPTGTEVNQAWFKVDFSAHEFSAHEIKIGRQRIVHDNQRFVGGVAWRQNEQTFDAASFDFELAGGQLLLSYVNQVNRIFGGDVAAGKHNNNTLLANWSRSWYGQHQVAVYYYDIDNEDVRAFSTQSYGFSFDSFLQLEDKLLSISLDYARQSDAANNPVNYVANYWRVEGALETSRVDFILGREVLSGNSNLSGAAFRTPLATLHAFNGWSDQFLTTPDTGLTDTYIGLIGSFSRFNWYVRYHNFEAESTNQDYGRELDASLSMQLTNQISTRLKYAQYQSDGFSTDTQHLWFLISFAF